MKIVPVPFSVEGAHMLQHAKWLMEETDEDGSSLIAIEKRFDKLLTGLRTAVANEYKLDKEVTSYDDMRAETNTTHWFEDIIYSKPPNKILHDWGQSPVEAEYVIKHITVENQIVLDPFMGSAEWHLS